MVRICSSSSFGVGVEGRFPEIADVALEIALVQQLQVQVDQAFAQHGIKDVRPFGKFMCAHHAGLSSWGSAGARGRMAAGTPMPMCPAGMGLTV